MLVLPGFQDDGNLPPGIHWAEWQEIHQRFACNPHRHRLLQGFHEATYALKRAGCKAVFLDGSYVTGKDGPEDFDACWDTTDVDPDLLDPVFFDFSNRRAAQKARFRGELFPAQWKGGGGRTFLEFFQIDKYTGAPKGIVGLDLRRWSV